MEMRYLGWFFRKTFPTLFERYSPKKYLFLYTNTSRTKSSYKAFTEGIFGPKVYKIIESQIEDNMLNVNFCYNAKLSKSITLFMYILH